MENGSFTAGKWFLQQLSELPYAPAISLLNTHPPPQKKREQVLNMYVLIYIFIDTAQNSREKKKQQRGMKQPKCPSMDGWRSKLWYIHTTEGYSAIKRTKYWWSYNMDEPGKHCAKWRKPDMHHCSVGNLVEMESWLVGPRPGKGYWGVAA